MFVKEFFDCIWFPQRCCIMPICLFFITSLILTSFCVYLHLIHVVSILQMCCPLPCFAGLVWLFVALHTILQIQMMACCPTAERSSRTHSPLSVIVTPAVHLQGTIYRSFRTNGPRFIALLCMQSGRFCVYCTIVAPRSKNCISFFVLEN